MVRAQLILATGTLLKPPYNETYMPLWPVASEWLPQPHFHIMQRSVGLHKNSRERHSTVIYDDDQLALYHPPEDELRLAPIAALERAATHPAAVGLLSAAWSLYLAARPQTELQWIDRLMLVQRARNQICEQTGRGGSWQERWEALSTNLSLTTELSDRGFDAQSIEALSKRAWDLRNISIHSGDAVLISLGYPPSASSRCAGNRQFPAPNSPPCMCVRGSRHPSRRSISQPQGCGG